MYGLSLAATSGKSKQRHVLSWWPSTHTRVYLPFRKRGATKCSSVFLPAVFCLLLFETLGTDVVHQQEVNEVKFIIENPVQASKDTLYRPQMIQESYTGKVRQESTSAGLMQVKCTLTCLLRDSLRCLVPLHQAPAPVSF